MKKTASRSLLALLTAALLASSLSCGSDGSAENTTVASDGTAAEVTTAVTEISDELPDKDYDGYTFTMFIRGDDGFIADMWAESANGDIMNDAIYDRNQKVAERFNVAFEMVRSANVYANDAKNTILAGDDVYDILVCHARTTSDYAHNQLLLEWNADLPYIDLDKPWWNQDARNSLSICRKLYTCAGDISYQNLGAANALFYNKAIFEDLGINDIYDTVNSGDWTFDAFTKLAKQGSRDLNGDSVMDKDNDRFGYITSWWVGPIQVLYTGSQRICTKNADDELVLSLNTERTVDIFEKFFAFTDGGSSYIQLMDGRTELVQIFSENRAMFFDANVKAMAELRDMKADFGVIPWPKFDESEDKYYTNVDAGCNLIGVPICAGDPERTSVILEALCAEGYRSVMSQYYEVALQTKYSRDDESVQMLDYIRDGRVFDVGYYYSNSCFVGQLNSVGRYLAEAADHNFASLYAQYETQGLQKLEDINKIYRGE